MKTFEDTMKKEAEGLRLSQGEKRHMRASLEAHMVAYPARPTPSSWLQWRHVTQFALAPLAVLLMFAGTAYAAQGSLPGDLLYPVKIHVNENVEVALATTPRAKVAIQTRLAKERVVEAQTLAAAGRLDATTTQQLEDNFNTHANIAISIASSTIDLQAAKHNKDDSAGTTTPTVATTTATSTVQNKTLQIDTKESDTPEDEDSVSSLKTSLSDQSNVLQALKLHIATTSKSEKDENSKASTNSEKSRDEHKSKKQKHEEGE